MEWIWGGFAVGGPTLNRLYSLHYFFPFVIAGVVVLHIWALHIPGNNNPTGIDVKSPRDAMPFHPYYTIKDGFALVLFALLFAGFVFYAPNLLGHPDNYIPANPLQTPPHIVPEWYFLPFYAILRAIPNKLFGVAGLIGSIAILFFVPWLDTSRVRSTRYRPIYKWFFWAFVVTCFVLGYLGSQPPEGAYLIFGRIFTAYYFLFFLVVMPVVGWIEKPKRTAGQHHQVGARAGGGEASVAEARAATPCAGGRWYEDASVLRTALAAGLVLALALSPRAASLRMKPSRRGRQAAAEASSHAPAIESQRLDLHRAVRHLRQRPAPARLPGLSRRSARTAIRCGCSPTAISASRAARNSRRRRSRLSPRRPR